MVIYYVIASTRKIRNAKGWNPELIILLFSMIHITMPVMNLLMIAIRLKYTNHNLVTFEMVKYTKKNIQKNTILIDLKQKCCQHY